ncbi:hypothetical protein [Alloactinosynnema sp. L-07]|nr:hypothetical protein [Alloactinosynnema sp. L-07]
MTDRHRRLGDHRDVSARDGALQALLFGGICRSSSVSWSAVGPGSEQGDVLRLAAPASDLRQRRIQKVLLQDEVVRERLLTAHLCVTLPRQGLAQRGDLRPDWC